MHGLGQRRLDGRNRVAKSFQGLDRPRVLCSVCVKERHQRARIIEHVGHGVVKTAPPFARRRKPLAVWVLERAMNRQK